MAALSPEAKAFLAAYRQNLRQRAALIKDTTGSVLQRLRATATQIAALLAEQPADWRQWQLTTLQGQVQALIEGMQGDVSSQVDAAIVQAWATGVQGVDAPLAAAQIYVDWQLPMLDTALLTGMRNFAVSRIKDLGAEALGRIDSAIGLAAMGAQTPNEAVQAVQAQLGAKDAGTLARAQTIVRTSLSQAYSAAGQARKTAAMKVVPDLQKQWRRSGKIHSRWNHDAADGQVVDADKPFRLRSKQAGGFVELMYPHDPKAPAAEVINCGCVSRPWLNRWGLPPGGTPFTEQEQKLNPLKAGPGGAGGT